MTAAVSGLAVIQALRFSFRERIDLDNEALAFVLLPCSAPFQNDGAKGRVLSCPPGQGRVPGGQEDEMIEVGTRQAQRTEVLDKSDPRAATEVLAAIAAYRFTVRNEHLEFLIPLNSRFHQINLPYQARVGSLKPLFNEFNTIEP